MCGGHYSSAFSAYYRLFRATAYRAIEYSYDAETDRHGTMVPGDEGILPSVMAFAASVPFADKWAWAVRQFTHYVHPDSYLLRADWHAGEVRGISLYCRFPQEPTDESFAIAMSHARPVTWSGPSPATIASALGVPGPRGVGLRVDADQDHQVAIYFTVRSSIAELPPEALQKIVHACGYPPELGEQIRSDLPSMYRRGPIGVVGIDSGSEAAPGALKFNPANVPLDRAFTFLESKGARPARLKELGHIARSLRAFFLSYLGVRYSPTGFSGWRVYFSIEPIRFAPALLPRLAFEHPAIPTLRLPHY